MIMATQNTIETDTASVCNDPRPVPTETQEAIERISFLLKALRDGIEEATRRQVDGCGRSKRGERFRWEDAIRVGEVSLSYTFLPGHVWQVGCLYYVLPDLSGRTNWLYPRALSRNQLECWLRGCSPSDQAASGMVRRLGGNDSQLDQADLDAWYARLEVATMQWGTLQEAIRRQERKAAIR